MITEITTSIIAGLVERALAAYAKSTASGRRVSKAGRDEAARALASHLEMVRKWSSEIAFRDLLRAKDLGKSFVELDLTVGAGHRTARAREREFRVTDLRAIPGNFIIFGNPGAGKTTSIKRIAAKELADGLRRTPILIRVREIKAGETLAHTLSGILGIALHDWVPSNVVVDTAEARRKHTRDLAGYLDALNALLLIDGLDEIDPLHQRELLREVEELVLHTTETKVLLTSRIGGVLVHLDKVQPVTIQPLTEGQIRQFAIRWLGSAKAAPFIEQVRANPYAGTEVRPLNLAHLCAIYERTGSIPDKPRSVYRKIVRIYLSEWDEERGIKRASRYSTFTVDRKEDFLEAMAFKLTFQLGKTVFEERELEIMYAALREQFELPGPEASQVISELETHTGLLLLSSESAYEFAHKSLQEYLSASFIVRLPEVPPDTSERLANEFAIAAALSSSSSEYLLALMRQFGHLRPSIAYVTAFAQRLRVERVDFRRSMSLGAAMLCLYNSAYYMPPVQPARRRQPQRDVDIVNDLVMEDRPVAALVDFLGKSRFVPVSQEIARVVKDPATRAIDPEEILRSEVYYDRRLCELLSDHASDKLQRKLVKCLERGQPV
jgi:hypothetical protein